MVSGKENRILKKRGIKYGGRGAYLSGFHRF
jgi:hypothetical protein